MHYEINLFCGVSFVVFFQCVFTITFLYQIFLKFSNDLISWRRVEKKIGIGKRWGGEKLAKIMHWKIEINKIKSEILGLERLWVK